MPTEQAFFFSPGWSNTTTENSSHHQGPEFVEEDTPGQFRRVRLTSFRDYEALQKETERHRSDLQAKGNPEAKSLEDSGYKVVWEGLWPGGPINLPALEIPCVEYPSSFILTGTFTFHKPTNISHLDQEESWHDIAGNEIISKDDN